MRVLHKPIITEKYTELGEKLNRYGFVVDVNANKIQIKKAVEDMYNVTVDSVNTMKYGGKRKSRYTKTGIVSGKSKAFKKAIITLAEGEEIDFYSNI